LELVKDVGLTSVDRHVKYLLLITTTAIIPSLFIFEFQGGQEFNSCP
jgi:hypothetical protein